MIYFKSFKPLKMYNVFLFCPNLKCLLKVSTAWKKIFFGRMLVGTGRTIFSSKLHSNSFQIKALAERFFKRKDSNFHQSHVFVCTFCELFLVIFLKIEYKTHLHLNSDLHIFVQLHDILMKNYNIFFVFPIDFVVL